MTYMDFLKRDISFSFTGRFNLSGVYKEITRWAKTHQYTCQEAKYDASKQEGSESLKVNFDLSKKVSDYVKIGMFVSISASDIKNVKVKNNILQEGRLSTSITTYLKRDYDDVWSRKNYTRFFREVYDKFIGTNRVDADEKQITNDAKLIKNTIKDLLRAYSLEK